ncbi:MAG TPA: hypothetical protein VF984_15275 [Actinomycetota bacterium]
MGSAVGAGLLFGLAAWFPFTHVRYLWTRLLLAALALLPVAHFWLVWGYLLPRRHEMRGWLMTSWFCDVGAQTALAVLGGVAVASGFRAKMSEPEGTTG